MLYLCMGGFKKRLKESMKQKLARVSKSEAENRNSTIPTARETLLDNTVTNGSRANSLRFVNSIRHKYRIPGFGYPTLEIYSSPQ